MTLNGETNFRSNSWDYKHDNKDKNNNYDNNNGSKSQAISNEEALVLKWK